MPVFHQVMNSVCRVTSSIFFPLLCPNVEEAEECPEAGRGHIQTGDFQLAQGIFYPTCRCGVVLSNKSWEKGVGA